MATPNPDGALPGAGPPAPSHNIAVFFHGFFKVVAIVWYWICTIVSNSFVVNFVVCIVLLALDFWVTKNITGRLLVGLRWWNEANDTGSAWRFETLPEGVRQVLPREKRFFWLACMGATAHWILACIIAVFGLSSYIIVAIMGLLFSGSNLWGYFKCSREAQADLKGYINSTSNTLMQGAIKQQLNSAVSRV
ncbi:hypothetical protein CHLRE_16g683250v5 [Chlamydomonas reinhardtii]|uniref:Golgi apparatus membrane protein TVP23 n=1 Tax=Chlamydomonas reinhardtii TaxID=3055 RepID=A8IS54_CHLRE|nr:uncharacterized protein CHLRE_16g683250v5 [Chlamydomonas reinhardtii]PNW72080.1 hypothetical protein CHLRE_16g683250v5 [Chlamydomonas reinhardtii]|eukprot:XP_001692072.1 predicted protein [Chlamydomonas reinhardtii]